MKLGFHVSIADSIDMSYDRARQIGCTTFQLFTRNPRTWASRDLSPREVASFRRKQREYRIGPVFAHMPYLPNLGSPDEIIYRKSVDSLIEEVARCRTLGIHYIVTHIGSHVGAGVCAGKTRVVHALRRAVEVQGPMILLENGSGSGNHLGAKLDEVADIMAAVDSSRVGFCFDTCHAYGAGYDIASVSGLRETLHEIGANIGFSKLKLVHLNDSRGSLGSGVDHHEHIGMGSIGEDAFRRILASRLAKRPMIMETPIDERRSDSENMDKVYELASVSKREASSAGVQSRRR